MTKEIQSLQTVKIFSLQTITQTNINLYHPYHPLHHKGWYEPTDTVTYKATEYMLKT